MVVHCVRVCVCVCVCVCFCRGGGWGCKYASGSKLGLRMANCKDSTTCKGS